MSGESRFLPLLLPLEFGSHPLKQHLRFLPPPPTAELRRFVGSGANSQPVREEPASGGQRQAAHLPGIKWDWERLRLDESVVRPCALSGEYFPAHFPASAPEQHLWNGGEARGAPGEQVGREVGLSLLEFKISISSFYFFSLFISSFSF